MPNELTKRAYQFFLIRNNTVFWPIQERLGWITPWWIVTWSPASFNSLESASQNAADVFCCGEEFVLKSGGSIDENWADSISDCFVSDVTEMDLLLSLSPVKDLRLVTDLPADSSFMTKSLTEEFLCFKLDRVSPPRSNVGSCSFLKRKKLHLELFTSRQLASLCRLFIKTIYLRVSNKKPNF